MCIIHIYIYCLSCIYIYINDSHNPELLANLTVRTRKLTSKSGRNPRLRSSAACGPRRALRTSIKSQVLNILSNFGDKCPQNGSKNDLTAPRTTNNPRRALLGVQGYLAQKKAPTPQGPP